MGRKKSENDLSENVTRLKVADERTLLIEGVELPEGLNPKQIREIEEFEIEELDFE